MDRSVVLIGYRGSGKTAVGGLLAERLGCRFVDSDALVAERAGKSIAEIFAEDGEPAFRDLESSIIDEVCAAEPGVLSVGGGAVLREANVELMRAWGTVVWLRADAGTLWSRVARDAASGQQRPALTSLQGVAEVMQVLAEREPLYRRAAHFEVDASPDDAGVVVERVFCVLGH